MCMLFGLSSQRTYLRAFYFIKIIILSLRDNKSGYTIGYDDNRKKITSTCILLNYYYNVLHGSVIARASLASVIFVSATQVVNAHNGIHCGTSTLQCERARR